MHRDAPFRDRGGEAHARNVRLVHPAVKESLERLPRLFFKGHSQIVGARLGKLLIAIEPSERGKERLITDETPQHMQYAGGLVVNERSEDTPISPYVTEPIPQIDGTLIRLVERPPPELPEHLHELLFTVAVLCVQRGEILRKPFAQPLLVVVLPADGLAPPLMCDLMSEKEVGEAVEALLAGGGAGEVDRVLVREDEDAAGAEPAGRLGATQGAFFGVGSELWRFSVSELFSPQPPVTQAVSQFRNVSGLGPKKEGSDGM